MSYAAIKGALQGVAGAKAVYLLVAPQSAPLPFYVMQRISQAPLGQTFDGPTDLEPGRYQIAYWTDDATKMATAERETRTALASVGFIEGLSDDVEAPASGEARNHVARWELEIIAEAQEA